MNKSLEDLILNELAKHHPKTLDAKLSYFSQICERLGLEKKGLNEIQPKLEKLFRDEWNEGIH